MDKNVRGNNKNCDEEIKTSGSRDRSDDVRN